MANEICRRIAAGETLRQVCRDERMPAAPTVRLWVLDDREGFAERYARARMLLAEHWADELIEIADDARRDCYDDDKGHHVVDHEHINRSRLRVDTRKFLLAKIMPKVYGDKVALEHTGQDGGPLRIVIERTDDWRTGGG